MSDPGATDSHDGDAHALDDETLRFVQGDKIEVRPEKIEAEISRLWRKAALSQAEGKKRVVTRACLWNLVVRTRGADSLLYAKKLIDDVAAVVPVRALLLHEDADDSDSLRAFIESNWMRPGGGAATGSDEITLVAGKKAVTRLPSLARALLISDAPTAMLWVGPPPLNLDPDSDADPIVLLDEVDRLIIDTRKGSESDLRAFAELARARPALEIVDLAWLGLASWRTILASLFEPPFDPQPLADLTAVEVASEVKGAQSSTIYLYGWLATRLGWKGFLVEDYSEDSRHLIAASRRARAIHLSLDTRPKENPRGLASITLVAGNRRWSLERRSGQIAVQAPDLPERAQPKRTRTDGELAVIALGPRGRDPAFREALAAAAELVTTFQNSGDMR